MTHLFQEQIDQAGPLAPLLKEMREAQQEILKRQDASEKLASEMNDKLEDLVGAFPKGDLDGHRRYHEAIIELLEERRRLRMAIMEKSVAGLVWAVLVFVLYACWNYIKNKLKG